MFALLVCLNLIVRTVLTQTVGNDMRQQTRTSFLFYVLVRISFFTYSYVPVRT